MDHRNGAAATGDRFLDKAAGLNGDVIGGCAGSDAIGVTDIASAGVGLSDGGGVLMLSDEGVSTSPTLTGSFAQSSTAMGSTACW